MSFLLRRLVFYVVAAWIAVTLNFAIPRLMPGNPVSVILARFHGQLDPQAISALDAAFGVGRSSSLLSQYGTYLDNLFHGNLGVSTTEFPSTVSSVIGSALPWTICLIGIATILSFVIGTLAGVVVAWRRGSWMDGFLPVITFFSAVPYFWLALIALTLLSLQAHLLPSAGGYNLATTVPGWSWSFVGSAVGHGVLPALTIVVSSMAGWVLGMRNMMLTTMAEDYVLTAQAKGLSNRRVIFSYAARNAVLPSVAGFALSLGFIVTGAILTEIVFSYPGIGYVLYQAVTNNDYPLLQGIFLVIAGAVLLANLLADVAYAILDPRTRQAG